jgi:hypothetical protein
MEVGPGPNWGCSAEEKKIESKELDACRNISDMLNVCPSSQRTSRQT